jgi:hypothetical protein
MINLKPFRQYSEHDVINLFSYIGNYPTEAGTIVKITHNYQNDGNVLNISTNLTSANNALSPIFGVAGSVTKVLAFNETPRPIGILLNNVAEYDENGDPLIYNPRKAAETNTVLPNQAVPILTKGIVLINEIDLSDRGTGGGAPETGDTAYVGNDGKIGTDGIIPIGQFLSEIDSDGYALVKLNF